MAYDEKYGTVTVEREPGRPFGDDEPLVVFRGSDKTLTELLHCYAQLCEEAGSPGEHIDSISALTEKVRGWQIANGCKVPD